MQESDERKGLYKKLELPTKALTDTEIKVHS
jgi:hypothetical protein